MKRFRKKPVVIEAVQVGSLELAAIIRWIEGDENRGGACEVDVDGHVLAIATLEGVMSADPGDWIIKGVAGEFYPCKPEIFEATYEAV